MVSQFVIAGLDPATHRKKEDSFDRWMRGSSPRVTTVEGGKRAHDG
jgi:hypothetical protein